MKTPGQIMWDVVLEGIVGKNENGFNLVVREDYDDRFKSISVFDTAIATNKPSCVHLSKPESQLRAGIYESRCDSKRRQLCVEPFDGLWVVYLAVRKAFSYAYILIPLVGNIPTKDEYLVGKIFMLDPEKEVSSWMKCPKGLAK
jgi:hypothetical protein